MTFGEVAYVSQFLTNVVCEERLRIKDIFFDSQKMRLYCDGITLGLVENYHGHCLLENNLSSIIPGEPLLFFATTKTGSMDDWRNILGHASHNAIKHLEMSAEGVKFTDQTNRVPKTNKCQTCALSKAHQIISRSLDKSESLDISFYRVTYNLTSFTMAINKDQWVSYFSCIAIDFNLVFTHPRKLDAIEIIQKALNIIETHYNGKVVFFKSDGKKALGINFHELISSKRITFESLAPDTPSQNGHSEYKKGILAMKTKAMRTDAGLPTYLWNKIIRTAEFIIN